MFLIFVFRQVHQKPFFHQSLFFCKKFEELDNLLEEIAPNVTFLHYKKIRSQCVKTEESYERDYYGGGCSYLNWVCDLEKLYDLLEQQGYIEEE